MKLYIAIDPASKKQAVAMGVPDLGKGAVVTTKAVQGVDQMSKACQDIASVIRLVRDSDKKAEVVLCIERPSKKYRGSNHVVSAMARQWEREIRANLKGDRLTVRYVDPLEWQSQLLKNCPGENSKEKSRQRILLTESFETAELAAFTQDQFDALNILRWAEANL